MLKRTVLTVSLILFLVSVSLADDSCIYCDQFASDTGFDFGGTGFQVSAGVFGWDTDDNYSNAVKSTGNAVTSSGQQIIFNDLTYSGHDDSNTRQRVNIGLSDGTPKEKESLIYNFIGFYINNYWNEGNVGFLITKDTETLYRKEIRIQKNVTVLFSAQVAIHETSMTITIRQNNDIVVQDTIEKDATGISLPYFSGWNKYIGADGYSLQGWYKGSLNEIRWVDQNLGDPEPGTEDNAEQPEWLDGNDFSNLSEACDENGISVKTVIEEIDKAVHWLQDVSNNYIAGVLMDILSLTSLNNLKLSIDLAADLSDIGNATSNTHAAFIVMNRIESIAFSVPILGATLQMTGKNLFSGNRKISIVYDGVDYSDYSFITQMFANVFNIIDIAMNYCENWIQRQYDNAILGYPIDSIGWQDFWDWYTKTYG